jgi:uncharacterized membrane protein
VADWSPLWLVPAAAALHASWNLLAKRAAPAGDAFVLAYTVVSALAYAPAVAWIAWHGGIAWGWPLLGWLLASGLLHLGYSLALQRGYRAGDLSVVYPIARGTSPMLSSVGAFLLLGEAATTAGVAGLLAVVCGIVLVATGGRFTAFAKPEGRAGVGWGLATGGVSAGYTVVDGAAVKLGGVAPVVLDWGANSCASPSSPRSCCATAPPPALRCAATGAARSSSASSRPLGYILVLTALTLGAPLHIVAPMRELSVMLGALLGMWLLREPLSLARWAAPR